MLLFFAAALAPVQTFSIREQFGVAHPPQIIDFDFAKHIDASRCYMVGPRGAEVPFQLLHDGRIAVEAELPPHSQVSWTLYNGRAPQQFPNSVHIAETDAYYEITNSLTGVRIARGGNPELAPIQGILYRDGTWTANGPNYLEAAAKASRMTVRFLESGPLKTVVEVSYTLDRLALVYGGKELIQGGAGYYRSTVEIQAGQPSVLIEDDTDADLRYALDIYYGLDPDQARYRGHHSTSIENGREPDGRPYRMWHERPEMDALRDLQYRAPAPSNYNSDAPNIRRMAVWDPWIFDSGWYWMLYDAKAGADANLLGIFAGPASKAIGAAHNGAGISTSPGPHATIVFEAHRRAPDARVFPRVRIAWGIFIGTKGRDLGDPYKVQNIARQMNLHGGINLNKVHRIQTDFPDPQGGYHSLYMNRAAVNALIQRVCTDPGEYRRLYNEEPTARPLLDMWHDSSGAKLSDLAGAVSMTAHDLLDALVNGDGIYDFKFHYWHGGLEMTRAAVWINAILTDSRASTDDRARMKAAAALFAAVLWDNDFVPMFDGHGLNLGTANMPVQQNQYRDVYAVFLSRDRKGALQRAMANLNSTVNESGANMGSTHYIGASMGPLLTTFQQLQTADIADAFRDQPRLANFAEFYLNLLTPPEPRFGGYRKVVSIGDSSTESSELYGQLATGFAASNPDLSARLMAAWRQSGAMHSGFHGSTLLKIDESLPAGPMHLGDANFPGWFTVLRNGWGTQNETAVWLVDGDFYRDHAHEDNGAVVIYALGAPLSIDWGSMYSPQSAGAFMHSIALPETALPFAWDTSTAQLNQIGFRWHATGATFESFDSVSHVTATYQSKGATWTREVYSLHPDPSHPAIVIRDSFDPADVPMVLTLNLMGQPLPSGPGFAGPWLIDWDLYHFSAAPAQTVMRSWSHNWHPNREQNEFAKANGRPFEENQSIFRTRTTGASTLLLLPRHKGDPGAAGSQPAAASQTARSGKGVLVLNSGTSSSTLNSQCYTYADGGKQIVASFTLAPCAFGGIAVEGGPVEVSLDSERVSICAHGPAGRRAITLPGVWIPESPLTAHEGRWILDYQGSQPMTISLSPARRRP